MKKFKAMVALLLCASMLAACSNGGNSSSSSSQGADDASGEKPVLVVSNFALADDRIKDTVIKPFEEKYNCTVVYEGGTNGERLTKLKNDPNTDVDVIYLAQQYAQQGVDAGLFEEIDYSRIPNAEYLLEKADFLKESKQGPAVTMNRLGIIYNPEKAGEIRWPSPTSPPPVAPLWSPWLPTTPAWTMPPMAAKPLSKLWRS